MRVDRGSRSSHIRTDHSSDRLLSMVVIARDIDWLLYPQHLSWKKTHAYLGFHIPCRQEAGISLQ